MLSLAALAFPAVAQAHHATVTASCTEAVFTYGGFHYNNTGHWVVRVDGAIVAQGTHPLTGSGGTYRVPLAIYGDHTVTASTSWSDVEKGSAASEPTPVMCGAPPAPAVTPAPPAPPAPASAVQGVQVTSPARPAAAVARLNTRSSCRSKVVRTTVRGTGMRRVTFSVNGRRVKTMKVRSGKRSVSTNLRRRSRNTQAITVRVRFANGRTRTLTARANRCAQAQVQPQFTG